MAKILHIFITACLFFVQGTWASETDESWVEIINTTNSKWLAKKGSGRLTNLDKQKNNGYVYAYEVSNKKDGTSKYSQLVVKLESCKKGYGHIYYNSMDGEFTGKDGFVRFGPTVGDALGSMACTSWDQRTGKVSLENKGDTWEVVASAENSGDKYALKGDTVQKIRYNNKQAVSALYGYNDIQNNKFSYGEYVISLEDCKRGFGVVHELDFDGKLISKTDIVRDGKSMLSAMVSALCSKI
jgi:hypothetical protein